MFRCIITTIFICTLSSFGEAIPKIKYNGKEIDTSKESFIFSSGSSLEFICEGIHPITWKLPILKVGDNYEHNTEEKASIEMINLKKTGTSYTYQAKLTVENVDYLDTGYFICHHVKEKDFDDTRVATKVYVYIQDNSHLLVTFGSMATVHFPEKNRAVIPCRTTHPNITVKLESLGDQLYPSENSRWTFNPIEGFITEEMNQEESGQFECVASNGAGVQERLSIHLTVDAAGNVGIPKPIIDDRNATRVSLNDKFQLNCSVVYQTTYPVQLQWIVPNTKGIQNGRIEEGKFITRSSRSSTNATGYRILTVNKAELEDEGFYTCQAMDQRNRTESTEIGIRIPDYNTPLQIDTSPLVSKKNSASLPSMSFVLVFLSLIILIFPGRIQ